MRIKLKKILFITRNISLILGLVFFTSCSNKKQAHVRVENLGNTSLNTVLVYVKGDLFNLGNIEADESKSAIFRLNKESMLEIEFVNNRGDKKRLKADFNLEPNFNGFILIRIKDDKIVHAEKDYPIS
ncbi:MAG: hypothetical protein K1X72_17445 [Pyrinomonadaceae bacterium]|nr:hypothetical protein [Pyrinomonadaceae bacterium]